MVWIAKLGNVTLCFKGGELPTPKRLKEVLLKHIQKHKVEFNYLDVVLGQDWEWDVGLREGPTYRFAVFTKGRGRLKIELSSHDLH